MKTTVVVPTFKRHKDLVRCLTALQQQNVPPCEVIVVVREDDVETWAALEQFSTDGLPLTTRTVKVPGVVAAMNLGLEAAQGDIVAFTDDDAAPHPDWIQRIEAQFVAQPEVGGVGGRDIIQNPQPWFLGSSEVVGRLQWHGRLIGNHHKGIGAAREVDILKGVNMSFRRSAIGSLRFDRRMLGSGAQVHFEVAFCLALKRQGWTLIYDPHILVDHYLAHRFDEDQRYQFNQVAYFNLVHNETVAVVEHLSLPRQIVFILWSIFIGTRDAYGLAQSLRFLKRDGFIAPKKMWICLRGRWQGWQTILRDRQPLSHAHSIAPNP
ncbi:glycosyltransferase family 2 protein [Nodosilinea sp. E11]|uniref:glycosyltransferase family 2 protein n=1 Tax=Nodosilinea sp. E11 TaxID=3037479 RepID=UPI002934C7F4|nr:glycosyltransferase [Nodosilinea sp. E11]WOD39266.1 glycosyltransferase [Nodosilinea sp. E11]